MRACSAGIKTAAVGCRFPPSSSFPLPVSSRRLQVNYCVTREGKSDRRRRAPQPGESSRYEVYVNTELVFVSVWRFKVQSSKARPPVRFVQPTFGKSLGDGSLTDLPCPVHLMLPLACKEELGLVGALRSSPREAKLNLARKVLALGSESLAESEVVSPTPHNLIIALAKVSPLIIYFRRKIGRGNTSRV